MGWDGYDDVHLHLHTCLMLRNRMFHVGVGWGGVGMMTFICTWYKPAITFVVKVLRDGLPRYILYTCLQPVITFVFKMLCVGLPRYILYTCPNL